MTLGPMCILYTMVLGPFGLGDRVDRSLMFRSMGTY